MDSPGSETSYVSSPLTRPSGNPQRVTYDRPVVHAVLDSAFVCHVGFVVERRPVVLLHLYARVGEIVYIHASTGARAMRTAQDDGLPICVTVTPLDSYNPRRRALHARLPQPSDYETAAAAGRLSKTAA